MKNSLLALALFCITICSAQNLTKIKGNEKIITVTRTTASYNKILIAGSFDVKLISGAAGTIVIKGDENLIDYIITEVKNNKLSLSIKKGTNLQYNYNSSIEVTVPFDKIDELTFVGSGNVSNTDSINSENFDFVMSGSGNVKFETTTNNLKISKSGSGNLHVKGKAINSTVNNTGSGNANLNDLEAENVTATQSGSGSIKVFCTKSLTATTAGSGNIKYKGSPSKISKNSAGSGSVTSY